MDKARILGLFRKSVDFFDISRHEELWLQFNNISHGRVLLKGIGEFWYSLKPLLNYNYINEQHNINDFQLLSIIHMHSHAKIMLALFCRLNAQ